MLRLLVDICMMWGMMWLLPLILNLIYLYGDFPMGPEKYDGSGRIHLSFPLLLLGFDRPFDSLRSQLGLRDAKPKRFNIYDDKRGLFTRCSFRHCHFDGAHRARNVEVQSRREAV